MDNNLPVPIGTPQTQIDSVMTLILRLANAMNVEIGYETQKEYLRKLVTLRLDVLTKAVNMLIENWTEPSKIPPPGSILYAYNHILEHFDGLAAAHAVIQRKLLAEDTSPVEERVDYSKNLVLEMRKAIAEGAFQAPPKLEEVAEEYAAGRNGKSQVPADHAARREWASRKAEEHGWE